MTDAPTAQFVDAPTGIFVDAPTGPLAGAKVLELAQVVAGPTCGFMLADLGAEVIKIERVPGGDDTRRMTPPEIDGESAAFMMLNRNKRGIALNLKNPEGKEVFLKLARGSDVVIENFRKGAMDRLGLGYEALAKENPALIYAAISGFGRSGPYAERGGYDLVAQAMSGLMSITGEGPGRAPVKIGSPVCDYNAGVLTALGIVSAYVHRLKSGQGQFLDTSLFEAGISATFHQSAMYFATGVTPAPLGSGHPLSAPYQAYETSDGWITVGAGNQANWARLCKALGAPELVEDARFATNDDRMANLDAMNSELDPLFAKHTIDQLMDAFEQEGVPAGPVLDIAEMSEDPQAIAREMTPEVTHARLGPVRTLGSPIKFSGTPTNLRSGAPILGQHTAEIMRDLGYSDADIDRLAGDGAVIVG
ncbi:MAG: CoA transferase [Pseudomonadota bacterium]|nr:CoA transferase [Pseudomonadota bacterium]